ncbi:MAG: discoidin domain-containing protein [Candidatus Aquicultor sp.]
MLSLTPGNYMGTAIAGSRPVSGVWFPAFFNQNIDWSGHLNDLKNKGVTDYYVDTGNMGASRFGSTLVSNDSTYVDKVVAGKPSGMRLHLWHQNFYIDSGSSSYSTLQSKDAFVRDAAGTPNAHFIDPANDYAMNLDKQVTMEMLTKYAGRVDGYHFDYIRYPGNDTGYTAAARAKFQAKYGTVANWPSDVRPGGSRYGQFVDFKTSLVTAHVADVSAAIRAKYPNIQISAAVFPDINNCRNNISQDWPTWKSYINVFVNMTYVDPSGNSWFSKVTQQNVQLSAPNAQYTGIGVFGEPGHISNSTSNMLTQAKAAIGYGSQGVVVWDDEAQFSNEVAPQLKSYLDANYGTEPAPAPMPTPTPTPTEPTVKGNLAQGKGVWTSSVEAGGYESEKAVDGDMSTYWSSQYSDPQSYIVDLGSATDIGKVVLKWETAYAKNYEIRVSNDTSSWKMVASVTNSDGNIDTVTLPVGTNARYVSMHGTQRATGWGYALWEFEVYAPDNTTTTPVPGTGTTPDTSTTPPGDSTTTPPVVTLPTDTAPPADTTPPVADPTTPPAAPDTQAPVTTFDDPLGTAILTGTEKLIKGTTMDDVAVKKVELTIQRGDGDYWTGSDWSKTAVWMPADIKSGDGTKIAAWTYLWQLVWSDNLPYTIKARGIDTAGNVEGTAFVAVRVDNVAPKGTITIDADSKFTNKKPVTVTNSIDGASKMRFMVDDSTWTPWEDYAGTKALELTNQPGIKTVVGQFSDGANTYETSDTIAYLDAPLAGITDIKSLVTYPEGWNMITVPADGANLETPLYTYSTADNAYQKVDTPLAGMACWAYFNQPVTVPVLLKSIDTYNVLLQPGWNMVGNPFDTAVTLPSGYMAYIYNPSTGDYETSTSIPEGGGAYINSPDARTLTLSR